MQETVIDFGETSKRAVVFTGSFFAYPIKFAGSKNP